MDTRLYYTTAPGGPEPIEELSVVALTRDIPLGHTGCLPEGSSGAVVFVHNHGEAYEVEFTDPVELVVTLAAHDIRLVEEATRERVVAASDDLLHRHRKD